MNLLSIQANSDKIATDKNYLEALAFHSKYDESISSFMADPATVAQVVSAIVSVIQLMKGDDDEMEKAVNEINEKLDDIIYALVEVVKLLIELEFVIKEEFRKFIEVSLRSYIKIVTESYPSWKKSSGEVQIIFEVTGIYNDLKKAARDAMQYKYAHYDSIGFAFANEILLYRFLKKDIKEVTPTAKEYAKYFTQALSYLEEDSVAWNQQKTIDNMSSLANRYIAQRFKCDTTTRENGDWTYFYDIYITISGSIADGFSYSTEFVLTRKQRESRGRRGGSDSLSDTIRTLLAPGDGSAAQNIMRDYDTAHNTYLLLKARLLTINNSLESCREYLKEINKFIFP